jgi:hypothetical protein
MLMYVILFYPNPCPWRIESVIGYNYLKENNTYWRTNQKVLMPLSSLKNLSVTSSDVGLILTKSKCLLARWESDFDSPISTDWWHVIKDTPEDLASLSKKVRYEIRRAQKKYYVKRCSREYILEHGHTVYKDAYARYETHEKMFNENEFNGAIIKLPDCTEFVGVFTHDDILVGFSENFISDNTCFYLTMWLSPEHLKSSSSYLLFHEMNVMYLNERHFEYVSDGSRSLSHSTNIHNFLMSKFAFRKAYCNLNVSYSGKVAFFIALTYPLKNIINKFHFPLANKVSVLLKQEEIRRSCRK